MTDQRKRTMIAAVYFLFSFCFVSWADELSDLKAKVKQLEEENRQLRSKLEENNLSIEKPVQVYEEASLVSFLGAGPKDKPIIRGGFIDLNYYHDDRDFNVFTVNLLANLPADIQYFSLTNFTASTDSKDGAVYDLVSFFTEQHFRKPIAKNHPVLYPLDWTVQYVDGSSAKDLVRFGTRVRFADIKGAVGDFFSETLGVWYNIDFHWYESDGEGYQIEHAYGGRYFDGFIIIGGFIDHGFDDHGNNFYVTEHQAGVRIVDNLYYVTELRYSDLRSDGDKWGTGFGLEYIIPF